MADELDATPLAPWGQRKAAIPCSTAGCGGVIWDDAFMVWRRGAGGQRLCGSCSSASVYEFSPRQQLQPWTDDEIEDAISETLSRIVELDEALFGAAAETPAGIARFRLGVVHRLGGDWMAAQRRLLSLAGERAPQLLHKARVVAGTLVLVQVREAEPLPTPVEETPDPAPPNPRPGVQPPKDPDW